MYEDRQYRPRSDAAEHCIWSGSTLFVNHPVVLYRYISKSKMDLLKPKDKCGKELNFTTLCAWANLADNILVIFFPEKRIWHFMPIVSSGDSLHEISKPVFLEK